MTVIFGASTDVLSSAHTSRFIGPILRWFRPDTTDATVNFIQIIVRKSGHLTEYALLALLLYRALGLTLDNGSGQWRRQLAGWALVLAVVYAASDEWHQSFVPSRGSSVHDVFIDAVGAALGLFLLRRTLLSRQERDFRPGN